MSSEGYHEPVDLLSEATKNMHRALVSLREELEAVDWYQQRAEGCSDKDLQAILVHNKNEEIEHAMMVLEWIRRHSPPFDAHIGTYLKSSGPITLSESNQADAGPQAVGHGGPGETAQSLGIGCLKAGT
jgi:ferritin-like protein